MPRLLPVRRRFGRLAALLVVLAAWAPTAAAQTTAPYKPSKERVDPLERRRDDIQGNNIRATITNWNMTGQSGQPGDFAYEYPKNTRRVYIALSQLWVGAKVRGTAGSDLFIVDVADFRNNPDGASRNRWTFQPVKGYVNPASSARGIAQSDDKASWPPFWPDKLSDVTDPGWRGAWNGYFGKNVFNADQEFMWKSGDDQYDRYTADRTAPTNKYFPDSTDLTRSGLGIVTESRMLAWSQTLIKDVVFALYGVKNDGSKDLPQVGISMWLADIVGGDGGDDRPFFDIGEDVVFMTDSDGRGTQPFGSDVVGVAGIAFLETPGNATNRIDDDGDGTTLIEGTSGEASSPVITADLLVGENPANGVDDNGNGLIDESEANIPFSQVGVTSPGVGYADYIDNDGDGEQGGPTVTAAMVAAASSDKWKRWPASPETDAFLAPLRSQAGFAGLAVHLVGVGNEDQGRAFRDGIDNGAASYIDGRYVYTAEQGAPTVTAAMVAQAASDAVAQRYVVRTNGRLCTILYMVGAEDVGKAYKDCVDNDGDGATDEGIDENIDEMTDESRDNGLDDDGDWNALRDDTGLDGVRFTGDRGDGDAIPTSGAGTDLPGEKNVDKTDVSESDQIGVTNVQRAPAFSINLQQQSDGLLYNTYMLPGEIDDRPPLAGENDFVVSSGLFPLRAGQTERISVAFAISASGRNNTENQAEVLRTIDNARDAYSADYQFAQAPATPTLTAVPGDGRVTLYWDAAAERSEDQFLADLGRDPRDFEGYLVYRSTDAAFLDPLVITDGRGNRTYRQPIARVDLKNGVRGFHPVDVNGVKFYLGDDTGLTRTFVDTTAVNGVTYYYAVTSYDRGAADINIAPTESPILIDRRADGTVVPGPNVAVVTPNAAVAGYQGARLDAITRVAGYTSSQIGYRIIDPTVLKPGTRYRVTFEDTLIAATNPALPDTLTTKTFTLVDLSTGQTVLRRSTAFRPGTEFPVFDDQGRPLGFSLLFFNEALVDYDASQSGWTANAAAIKPLTLTPYLDPISGIKGLRNPADYRVDIVADGSQRSVPFNYFGETLPARPTNVKVTNTSTGREVKYGYIRAVNNGADYNGTTAVRFASDNTGSDVIVLIEPQVGDPTNTEKVTWQIALSTLRDDAAKRDPQQGDVANLVTRKPFLETDAFEFVVAGASVSLDSARSALDRVRVVPNPYRAANGFEPQSAYDQGRGPRVIRFTNLPPDVTLRIFTVDGRLVRTLRQRDGVNDPMAPASMLNGTLVWDLLSEDNISVSYGVYLYQIEAPGVGQKTGTFAIIK